MNTDPQHRRAAGWIAAAAAVTAVCAVGGAAASVATVDSVVSALSAKQATSAEQNGQSFGDSGASGNSGDSTLPGQGGSGYGFGQSGDGSSSGAAATSSQQEGVVVIDTVLGYESAEAAGTGIILTRDGEILTNNHVVEGSTKITVTVASTGKSYTASVVGTDATDDVAVLQLNGASGLSTASLDDDGDPTLGDDVTAVGNAGGTGSLVAAEGTVTGLDKTITTEAESSVASETLNGLIETNADIEAGDSGGPLLDSEGEVVGIDTAASSGSTVTDGYAIPIDTALTIADQIESGQASSTVTIGLPAFLGVEVSPDTTGYGTGSGYSYGDDQGYGYSGTVDGASVAGVIDGTPAASAGLAEGDTITAVNGSAIASSSDLTTALAEHSPGDSVTLTWTDASGSSHSATVTLTEGPAA